MDKKKNYGEIIGWAFIILSLLIILTSFLVDLGFHFAAITLLILGLIFISSGNDAKSVSENSVRATATVRSMVPGFGNIYLGEIKKGICIFAVFILAIFMMILPFIVEEDIFVCVIYAIPLMIFSLVYSMVETAESCNRLNISVQNSIYELYIKDTRAAKSLTLAVFALFLLILDPLLRIELGEYDFRQLLVADVFAIIILIYAVFSYLSSRKMESDTKNHDLN